MFTYIGRTKYSLVQSLIEDTNKFDNIVSSLNPPLSGDDKDNENEGNDKKGGKHAFHGWQMTPDGMSKDFGNRTGPHFGTEGAAVTTNEVDQAYDYIKNHRPDELFVYSRGSAVWAKTQEAHPDVLDYVGKVNYLAPAKLRSSWKAADVELENKPGDVFAAAQDGKIPIKQAAKIAQDIGQDKIKIVDVRPFKSDMSNSDLFGTRGHQAARYPNWHLQTAEVPVGQIDDRFPDWGGTGSASAEDLRKQMKAAKEVGGFETLNGLEERALRSLIRNILMETQTRNQRVMDHWLTQGAGQNPGPIEKIKPGDAVPISTLHKDNLKSLRKDMETTRHFPESAIDAYFDDKRNIKRKWNEMVDQDFWQDESKLTYFHDLSYYGGFGDTDELETGKSGDNLKNLTVRGFLKKYANRRNRDELSTWGIWFGKWKTPDRWMLNRDGAPTLGVIVRGRVTLAHSGDAWTESRSKGTEIDMERHKGSGMPKRIDRTRASGLVFDHGEIQLGNGLGECILDNWTVDYVVYNPKYLEPEAIKEIRQACDELGVSYITAQRAFRDVN